MNWFRNNLMPTSLIKIVFLLGKPKEFTDDSHKKTFYRHLRKEIDEHGDLLIVDVVEAYINLTFKMLALFDFVLTAPECSPERAPLLRYVFKCGDDIMLNPTTFLQQLYENDYFRNKTTHYFIAGSPLNNIGMHRQYFVLAHLGVRLSIFSV